MYHLEYRCLVAVIKIWRVLILFWYWSLRKSRYKTQVRLLFEFAVLSNNLSLFSKSQDTSIFRILAIATTSISVTGLLFVSILAIDELSIVILNNWSWAASRSWVTFSFFLASRMRTPTSGNFFCPTCVSPLKVAKPTPVFTYNSSDNVPSEHKTEPEKSNDVILDDSSQIREDILQEATESQVSYCL